MLKALGIFPFFVVLYFCEPKHIKKSRLSFDSQETRTATKKIGGQEIY